MQALGGQQNDDSDTRCAGECALDSTLVGGLRRDDLGHDSAGRCDPTHRVWPIHGGLAADHGCHTAAERGTVVGDLCRISAVPGVSKN